MKRILPLMLAAILPACTKTNHLPLGQCYYYNRAAAKPGALFNERVNPFYYKAVRRRGRTIEMRVYSNEYVGRLLDSEKRLIEYSVAVPCAQFDSLVASSIVK